MTFKEIITRISSSFEYGYHITILIAAFFRKIESGTSTVNYFMDLLNWKACPFIQIRLVVSPQELLTPSLA